MLFRGDDKMAIYSTDRQTRRWDRLTASQQQAARRFADRYGLTPSQAAKYLDWCFALSRGEITPAQFKAETGHTVPGSEPTPAPQPTPTPEATPTDTPTDTPADAPTNEPTPAPQPAPTNPTTDTPTPEIVNLTPHPLNLRSVDGEVITVPPSGTVARVAETREQLGQLAGLSVTRASYGAVEGLPAPEAGKIFVVSALVLVAVPGRPDVFAPGPAIRDAEGRIIGADGLSATPAYQPPPPPAPTNEPTSTPTSTPTDTPADTPTSTPPNAPTSTQTNTPTNATPTNEPANPPTPANPGGED
jgi:type VI secretion system secreted protein VgrG